MCKIHRIHYSIITLKNSVNKIKEFIVIFKKIGKCNCMHFFFCRVYVLEQKIRKNVYPCKPQFYYIKKGCKGVFVTRTCFRDGRFRHKSAWSVINWQLHENIFKLTEVNVINEDAGQTVLLFFSFDFFLPQLFLKRKFFFSFNHK